VIYFSTMLRGLVPSKSHDLTRIFEQNKTILSNIFDKQSPPEYLLSDEVFSYLNQLKNYESLTIPSYLKILYSFAKMYNVSFERVIKYNMHKLLDEKTGRYATGKFTVEQALERRDKK